MKQMQTLHFRSSSLLPSLLSEDIEKPKRKPFFQCVSILLGGNHDCNYSIRIKIRLIRLRLIKFEMTIELKKKKTIRFVRVFACVCVCVFVYVSVCGVDARASVRFDVLVRTSAVLPPSILLTI